jgi:beta-glucosidase
MSEDPMLTNRLGYEQYRGAVEMGSINGPKHMGFNDQELNRQGNACYMTEQKMRETDIRCYEGALSDAKATGVMMSFARIGAINVTNHIGLMKNIMREEWGFTGIITTDMGQKGYHEPYAVIMATCNQYAGFGKDDSFLGAGPTDFTDEATDKTWKYVTLGAIKKDPVFAEQARQTTLYQLYTIAHSATSAMKIQLVEKIEIAPWEYIFFGLIAVSAIGTVAAGAGFFKAVAQTKKEEK